MYIYIYIQENKKKLCKLKKREYRDGVKSDGQDRDGLVNNTHCVLHNIFCMQQAYGKRTHRTYVQTVPLWNA